MSRGLDKLAICAGLDALGDMGGCRYPRFALGFD
jgi:hypothetical protein